MHGEGLALSTPLSLNFPGAANRGRARLMTHGQERQIRFSCGQDVKKDMCQACNKVTLLVAVLIELW